MSKSHVGMDVKICPVTGKKHEVGILLDTRLKETLDRENVTGFEICPEVKAQLDKGFIALVGIDPVKSEKLPNGNITPSGAYRTGSIMYIKRDKSEQILNMDVSKFPFIFADDEAIQMLAERYKDVLIDNRDEKSECN